MAIFDKNRINGLPKALSVHKAFHKSQTPNTEVAD